jgi:hypothetical protein
MPIRRELLFGRVGDVDAATAKTLVKAVLLKPAYFFNANFAYMQRMSMAMSRGALNVSTRTVDPTRPITWEFSAFSQNGEDGIIDFLLSRIHKPNRYFFEIGASDGLENNSAYLAFAKRYAGLMVDGDEFKSGNAQRFLQPLNWAVRYVARFVEPWNAAAIVEESLHRDPDFFSLDIDGNDYFVLDALMQAGLRPKVICVEYNSAFGPDAATSIEYAPGMDYQTFHPSMLYYGVSIGGWRHLLDGAGYRFITVESRGVNGFFVDPDAVEVPDGIQALEFAENVGQLERQRCTWERQFAHIKDLPLLQLVPAP